MGMQQRVILQGQRPSWAAVRETLREHFGLVPEMRMIDGEIALPDETPPEDWRELRAAVTDHAGMVTLQDSGQQQIDLVIWGNADPSLQQAWHKLTWALAHLGNGLIETAEGRYTAEAFGSRLVGSQERD